MEKRDQDKVIECSVELISIHVTRWYDLQIGSDSDSCSMFDKKRHMGASSPILICIIPLSVHIRTQIQGSNLNNFRTKKGKDFF